MALTPNMSLSESRQRLFGGIFTLLLALAAFIVPSIAMPEYVTLGAIVGVVLLAGGLFMLFEYKKRWCVAKSVLGIPLKDGEGCAINPAEGADAATSDSANAKAEPNEAPNA